MEGSMTKHPCINQDFSKQPNQPRLDATNSSTHRGELFSFLQLLVFSCPQGSSGWISSWLIPLHHRESHPAIHRSGAVVFPREPHSRPSPTGQNAATRRSQIPSRRPVTPFDHPLMNYFFHGSPGTMTVRSQLRSLIGTPHHWPWR